MSHYLNDQQFADISNVISIYSIRSMNASKLSTYSFDCGKANEYKTFLFEKAISKTFIMIHNQTNELIGYFTLSADTIRLTETEKTDLDLSNVPFMTLPAIKVGKLAINKKLSKIASRKGYGSFALDIEILKLMKLLKTELDVGLLRLMQILNTIQKQPHFMKKMVLFKINQ